MVTRATRRLQRREEGAAGRRKRARLVLWREGAGGGFPVLLDPSKKRCSNEPLNTPGADKAGGVRRQRRRVTWRCPLFSLEQAALARKQRLKWQATGRPLHLVVRQAPWHRSRAAAEGAEGGRGQRSTRRAVRSDRTVQYQPPAIRPIHAPPGCQLPGWRRIPGSNTCAMLQFNITQPRAGRGSPAQAPAARNRAIITH